MTIDPDPYTAYCAGLYEGEGTVYYYQHRQIKRGRTYTQHKLILQIAMTDLSPLQNFQEFMNVGIINGPYYKNNKQKGIYQYYINKPLDVQKVMELMTPWLSPRRFEQWNSAYLSYIKAKMGSD